MNSSCHVYLDLDVINNSDPSVDSEPPALRFEEIRNSPFLTNTEDYFCSIIRFSIQTGSTLPLFIPRIQTGQSDPNQTVYIITLVFVAPGSSFRTEFTLPVAYIPNNNQPVPGPPTTKQDLSTSYYYVQSYQDFVNMINATIKTLWSNLIAAEGGEHSPYTIFNHPPFLIFNPDDGKFVIYGDIAYLDESITSNLKIELWFNTRLFELMSGFPAFYNGPSGNKNYRILFRNYYNNNVQQINYSVGGSYCSI
jgi:hypothetical protein